MQREGRFATCPGLPTLGHAQAINTRLQSLLPLSIGFTFDVIRKVAVATSARHRMWLLRPAGTFAQEIAPDPRPHA